MRQTNTRKIISVIIPAHNEEQTIGAVVRVASTHAAVDEVIVVDDGSADRTGEIAERCGAHVLRLKQNTGKATAMDIGVEYARNAYICFLDADLHCLTHRMIDCIVGPVLRDETDMFVALRGRTRLWINRLLLIAPIIGGERCLKKYIWYTIPEIYKENFKIEIALNYSVKKYGWRMNFNIVQGLRHTPKVRKRGLSDGLRAQVRMARDLIEIVCQLYIKETLKHAAGLPTPKKHST